jgi:hypothetical protein
MSEINDALKRAQQTPSSPALIPLPLREPLPDKPNVFFGWIIPIFIIILVFTAIFFIGWGSAHHTIHKAIAKQEAILSTQTVADVVPVFQTSPPPPPPPPVAVAAPALPRLQGIFYSATAPTAILDGKTISPGDKFGQYRVKEISKYAVTLADTNGQEIKINMGN